MFNPKEILKNMESLRLSSGAFIAASTPDYWALWIRDHLYMVFCYYMLGEFDKFVKGVQVVFDVFHKHRGKLTMIDEFIHAKYHPETFEEITRDWGHHQLDAIGLFFLVISDPDAKGTNVLRNEEDRKILWLLISYLERVAYWERPDFGMWEECCIRHSSSIGAVVAGLTHMRARDLAVVPHDLIAKGWHELCRILPYESRDYCHKLHHRHDCDAAQLFLIWPFKIVDRVMADTILSRIIDGHLATNGEYHQLVQPLGVQRYWGDDYFRWQNGVSAQWQWEFLISIIFSERQEYEHAHYWFKRAAERIYNSCITEAFVDGKPNSHTPLGLMLALALIAFNKLPSDIRSDL